MNARASRLDPRHYQLAVLATLVAAGIALLDFGIRASHAVAILLACQLAQYLGSRFRDARPFDPKSALVTTLSLILLFRTDSVLIAVLAGILAIGSKYVLRIRGKHVFNPANFAIVTLMLASEQAWISTGQWGNATVGAFALACLGSLVLNRARRAETTLAFLFAYGGLLLGRALWLGDPLAIPLHHLQNGALLIFAFFMISDPRTTPDHAVGRLLFGGTIACVAFAIQFIFYQPYGPLLALYFCAPLVPLIDGWLRGSRYLWTRPGPPRAHTQLTKGA